MADLSLTDFDSLWDYGDPAATETRFQGLLPAAEASGDADLVAQLMTQIARTQGFQRRFDDAHRTLDQVEAALPPGNSLARVRYLLERGRVLNSSGQREQARPQFLQAFEAAQQVGDDGYAVDAAHMMGIVEPPQEALEWNRRALAIADASDQPRARQWLGSLYNNIGWTYHDMGDFEQALEIFRKALAWREAAGDPDTTRIAEWCIGRTLRSLGRLAEALDVQRALHAEYLKTGSRDGYVDEELGECLLALGQPEAARPHFADAYTALSQDSWLVANEPDRLARLKELGGVS
ncbi:MAG: tetratricopeptide repeat protein [Chloroflexi bacterium]|nr:tetratricopeptide repeat protein [Chloroflexota bacterium]